jgi:hypothetical protein
MNAVHWFIRRAIRRRLRQVAKALADPVAAQERLLLRLVRRAAATEWGRDHAYDRMRSVRDFQRAVPLCRYEDLAPLWHRAFDGARDVTWPGHIRYFALSSGTTAGASKALPVSREAIGANRRSGTTLLGLVERQAPDAELLGGRTLYFGGCTQLERRGACWQGDASGINARHLPRLAWRYRLPEPEVAALRDWEAKVETICERYLGSPVRAVVGLPSWTLILFRHLVDAGRQRIGRQVATVSDVWPDLRVFVNFGVAFEPYREQFRELVGCPIVTIDTYSSSEGGLNAIQSEQADPGMQLEVDGGAFYEFVPLAELDRDDPPRLTLAEVQTDVPYAILLSTASGIWAYDVGDVVRFTSLRPPKIVFASRTSLQLNVFGEHVIQEHLDGAMAEACGAQGAAVRDFTVASVLPTAEDPRGRHLWLVEFEGAPPPLDELARRLDGSVVAVSNDYAAHRAGDFGMAAPEIAALAPGTFYEWARRHGKLGGQHKVPRIALSQEVVDELRSLSKSLSPP